jgi:hypothetical protein
MLGLTGYIHQPPQYFSNLGTDGARKADNVSIKKESSFQKFLCSLRRKEGRKEGRKEETMQETRLRR